jgi:hypothetical protein
MTVEQLDALVLGLPWQQIADLRTIRVIYDDDKKASRKALS